MLTNKQEKRLKTMPVIETRINKSKDGKFLLHRTIITTIRPIEYYEAIVKNNVKEELFNEEELKEMLEE